MRATSYRFRDNIFYQYYFMVLLYDGRDWRKAGPLVFGVRTHEATWKAPRYTVPRRAVRRRAVPCKTGLKEKIHLPQLELTGNKPKLLQTVARVLKVPILLWVAPGLNFYLAKRRNFDTWIRCLQRAINDCVSM